MQRGPTVQAPRQLLAQSNGISNNENFFGKCDAQPCGSGAMNTTD
jgi:hypothetical protein